MKILSVIVLYNSPLEKSMSYKTLFQNKVDNNDIDLFIYDNSPLPMHNKSDFLDYQYVHDINNGGISIAYNTAAEYAKKEGYDWILLLDQDTEFPSDTILIYKDGVSKNPDIKLFAPVLKLLDGSFFSPMLEKYPRRNGLYVEPGEYNLCDYKLVNSGLLINVDAFWKCGGYNEKIKLDFADFQFILRFRKFYDKFCIIDCVGIQDFSSRENDILKLQNRFVFYCQSAKMFETDTFKEKMNLRYTVFRRMCGLLVRTKKVKFLTIYFKHYL